MSCKSRDKRVIKIIFLYIFINFIFIAKRKTAKPKVIAEIVWLKIEVDHQCYRIVHCFFFVQHKNDAATQAPAATKLFKTDALTAPLLSSSAAKSAATKVANSSVSAAVHFLFNNCSARCSAVHTRAHF